jgi:hypothetical protein
MNDLPYGYGEWEVFADRAHRKQKLVCMKAVVAKCPPGQRGNLGELDPIFEPPFDTNWEVKDLIQEFTWGP